MTERSLRNSDEEVIYPDPENVEVIRPGGTPNAALLQLMSNPTALQNLLNLSPEQAENVRALVTGSGSGAAAKLLSKYIGSPLAGAVGGFLGGIVSEKLLGRE